MAHDSDLTGFILAINATQKAKDAARDAAERESQHNARLAIETRIISYVERVSSLPRELSLKILRAAVASERLQWPPTDSDSVDTTAGEFYAWPDNTDRTQREVFQRDTEPILLETAIIEIPAHFISQGNNNMVPVIPKALEQNGQHVRRLVLDLRLDSRDSAYQRELNKTCSGMDALKLLFPRLKVCVVSFLKNRDRFFGSFHTSGLNLRNSTSFAQSETLETSLVKFINVFYQRDPSERKLVRFLDQTYNTSDAGPLVNVTIIATRVQAEEALRGEDAPGDTSASDIGKQVLTQAYCYHRSATYRREMPN
jgi:hypothetical protein